MINYESPDQGFTLVEMLVALTLLGFISLAGWHGMSLLSSAERWVEANASAMNSLQSADDVLRGLLSQTYPGVVHDNVGNAIVDFEGAADAVSFEAPLLQRYGSAVIVSYRIFDNHDGTLRLTWHMIDSQDTQIGAETLIAGDLASVAFAYFGSDDSTASPRWQGSWSHRSTLPQLIGVRLIRRDHRPKAWPDMIVAAAANAGPGCSFDPADGKCRVR